MKLFLPNLISAVRMRRRQRAQQMGHITPGMREVPGSQPLGAAQPDQFAM
jgi:hypothetical protein